MKSIKQVQFAPTLPTRKRTAGYARVSSGKDAMLHSLSAQVSYYSALIQSRADWEFAGIYCDEAVTGTKDSRAEFQRLLVDCHAGKIDQIITKSITRFARNTVDMLKTIRELKLLGIDVFFEEQNIHTMSADGEMVLAILAAHAQENSLRVSESCKWRIQRMFREGRPNIGRMLGYRLHDGKFHIVPEEAEIVRRIFADYLVGAGKNKIMRSFIADGIPSPYGRQWCEASIAHILRNEKYTGNMLLQKTYISDFLTKKKCRNHGELPRIFVEDSHEAIIGKATFDSVQREIERRATIRKKPAPSAESYPFTGLITCGACDAHYRRKHADAGSKYEKIVWICPTFDMLGKDECNSQQIPEEILTAKTLEAGGFDGLQKIIVTAPGALSFIYNEKQVDLTWQNPSRRQSWTPEMREAARQKSLEIVRKRKESQP